ncbi:MAG: hypothetical protein KKD73_02530 [Proteobacteria bacterium]|nr:hypothetical protein [Pseudomonadota bacterium]MBU1640345.1 hypothetical protein [Pseudomonadota bacterium]
MTSSPMQMKDYSQKAIKKEVVKNGLTHWLTIYPPSLGLPLGLAALLFDLPILYLGMIGALSLGLGSAIINIFFRNEVVAQKYIEQLNIKLKSLEKLTLATLLHDLKDCLKIPGAQQYAGQAVEQYNRIREKYRNVEILLGKKLKTGELTYARFLGSAEQVYLSGLDNLRQIESSLHSAGSIDPEYIGNRLKSLAQKGELSPADVKEKNTLTKRLELRRQQFEKVNTLLTNNEEAMTKLEETTAAIAEMQTSGKFAQTDYETAISQLQEMAERARTYNKS